MACNEIALKGMVYGRKARLEYGNMKGMKVENAKFKCIINLAYKLCSKSVFSQLPCFCSHFFHLFFFIFVF